MGNLDEDPTGRMEHRGPGPSEPEQARTILPVERVQFFWLAQPEPILRRPGAADDATHRLDVGPNNETNGDRYAGTDGNDCADGLLEPVQPGPRPDRRRGDAGNALGPATTAAPTQIHRHVRARRHVTPIHRNPLASDLRKPAVQRALSNPFPVHAVQPGDGSARFTGGIRAVDLRIRTNPTAPAGTSITTPTILDESLNYYFTNASRFRGFYGFTLRPGITYTITYVASDTNGDPTLTLTNPTTGNVTQYQFGQQDTATLTAITGDVATFQLTARQARRPGR